LQMDELDGPRPMRREELAASACLAALCFPNAAGVIEETRTYTPPRRGGIQVLCHRGVPVSQIGVYHSRVNVYGSPLRVASIGGVCTHPDYRGQGLSTHLLDYCVGKLTVEGARLTLISGMGGLYTRAGCVTAQEFEYIVLRAQISGTGALEVRPATEADASLCACLHQAEPVHFVRRVEEFAAHFQRSEEFPRAEDWMVEVVGVPVAYLFTMVPWEYWHGKEAGAREVVEYAGSRVALVGALARVMERLNLRELRLHVPWQDVDFLRLLREQGITGDPIPLLGHTMRVVNFPGLMSDLRPYLRARLTRGLRRGLRFEQEGLALSQSPEQGEGEAGGDRYAIVRGRERLELDGATMTRLVMGIPAEMAPEVTIGSGALGEIIPALFPLPSFLPGLNYR